LFFSFCDIIALVVCCLALTEANAATKESETVNGLRLAPAAKLSSQKAMASPPNNAVKGMLRHYKKRQQGRRHNLQAGTMPVVVD